MSIKTTNFRKVTTDLISNRISPDLRRLSTADGALCQSGNRKQTERWSNHFVCRIGCAKPNIPPAGDEAETETLFYAQIA